jgi:hypothetical protein
MANNAYTEDQLVEQPAIGLFAEIEWSTVRAMDGPLRKKLNYQIETGRYQLIPSG